MSVVKGSCKSETLVVVLLFVQFTHQLWLCHIGRYKRLLKSSARSLALSQRIITAFEVMYAVVLLRSAVRISSCVACRARGYQCLYTS